LQASVIFMGRKSSPKKKNPKASKPSFKETSRKKVFTVETDVPSKEEILSVELSTEDTNVSSSEVVNSVSDFPKHIYAAMEIQGTPVRSRLTLVHHAMFFQKNIFQKVQRFRKQTSNW